MAQVIMNMDEYKQIEELQDEEVLEDLDEAMI